MLLKRKIILVIFLLISITSGFSQDLHFSQMRYAPLIINPALAGAEYKHEASILYKDQWRSISAPYKTLYSGYCLRINDKKSWNGFLSAGVHVFTDKAGDADLGISSVYATVSYQLLLSSRMKIAGGIQPGFGQFGYQFGNLKWGNQFDGHSYNQAQNTGENDYKENINFFDVNTGVVFIYDRNERRVTSNDNIKISTGYSLYHITKPRYDFYRFSDNRIFIKHVFFVNSFIGVRYSKYSFIPEAYLIKQGPQQELMFGTYLRYKAQEKSERIDDIKGQAIAAGIFYRYKDAVSLKILYQYSHFDFGISYDINISPLRKVSNFFGGLEFCIRWVSPDPFVNPITRF